MKKLTQLTLGLCLSATIVSAETIEWTTGQIGGGWYTMAAGIAKIIEKETTVQLKIVPGGGTSNPSKVQKNKAQLGLGLDSITYLATQGKDIYKGRKHNNVALIAGGLSDTIFQVVRSKDAKFTNIGDLFKKGGKGTNIAVTKAGSSDEKIFSWLMAYYGTSYADMKKRGYKIIHGNYSEISAQYKDGLIDYAFVNLGTPGSSVIDMLLSREGIITNLPNDLMDSLKNNWGYNKGNLPANTYKGQDYVVNTGKMSTIFFANTNLSTNTVYNITKVFCENQSLLGNIHGSMKNFTCENALKNATIKVHPGAIKYYKEMGYIK